MGLLSARPKPEIDYSALAAEVDRLKKEAEFTKRWGGNPSNRAFCEEQDRLAEEAAAANKLDADAQIAQQAANEKRDAQIEKNVREVLDSGVLVILNNGKRTKTGSDLAVPCSGCGASLPGTHAIMKEMLRTQGDKVDPFELFLQVINHREGRQCLKCGHHNAIYYLVVPP
jgi:hypothetical protein